MEEADRFREFAYRQLLCAARFPKPIPMARNTEGMGGTIGYGISSSRELRYVAFCL